MLTLFRFICLTAALLHEKCQMSPLGQSDGDSSRIVNGEGAKPGQFPFAVSMQYFNPKDLKYKHTCTLSLITTKTCLGAAHCVFEEDEVTRLPIESLCGIVGTIDESQKSFCHQYSEVFVHESYDYEYFLNDIATFIFEAEMELDKEFVDTVPLIGAAAVIKEGTVTALGWGHLYSIRNDTSPKNLQYVTLGLLPSKECFLKTTQLCISTQGKGTCSGDSGGPNLISVSGKQVQIGVSSAVYQECARNISVSTAVGAFAQWIEEHSTGKPSFISI